MMSGVRSKKTCKLFSEEILLKDHEQIRQKLIPIFRQTKKNFKSHDCDLHIQKLDATFDRFQLQDVTFQMNSELLQNLIVLFSQKLKRFVDKSC